MKNAPTIAVVSSIAFYKQVINIKDQLKKLGFNPVVPKLALLMAQTGDFNLKSHLSTFYSGNFIKGKTKAIRDHFDEIAASDCLLVINLKKHGRESYIGPNVLMEMGLAFYLRKPIFIWKKVSKDNPFSDEISAMQPIFIQQKLTKLSQFFKKTG